ncbi:MAG TPA: glycoside hydrolase family 57, partial [Firmicutes bacterium]|nr:glycoside hydrolase family 57 [Bacillota bacterium]
MRENPLHVAFVWNQHQPYYLDNESSVFIMPWVRLHAVKDYYQMAALLQRYPTLRQTFNLTPSLLSQLESYLNGTGDLYQQAMKPAAELSDREKRFLLLHYFDIHWERVIGRIPRYRELLEKQGYRKEPAGIEEALARYTPQDYLDLQVWFNLAWIDPQIREEDSFLAGLAAKGRDYTEEEKEVLMRKQREIIAAIIPLHRELLAAGQIEIMTTPFYHPILPLIIDNRSARAASPGIPLPRYFAYPEDARDQLVNALRQYRRLFGEKPPGLWPPEMAVSPEMVPMLADLGFRWTISDEGILVKSLGVPIRRDEYGHVLNPTVLYQPYRVKIQGTSIDMVFRDHYLSDMIGFTYHDWQPVDAAANLVHRLLKIRENLKGSPGNFLVTISLDGENPWEWYLNDKKDFLNELYSRLSEESNLKTVTVAEYLRENPPRLSFSRLHTGSWVDHKVSRWIGTENKNVLWEYLARARSDFEKRRIEEQDEQKL